MVAKSQPEGRHANTSDSLDGPIQKCDVVFDTSNLSVSRTSWISVRQEGAGVKVVVSLGGSVVWGDILAKIDFAKTVLYSRRRDEGQELKLRK